EDPLTLDELSGLAGLSRRQIERHFRQFLGESPRVTYRNIRLDRARTLLIETDMVVSELAAACGFNSSGGFAQQYKDRFGVSPAMHIKKRA
ncbi:helix-turn-helix domain-containing protein, partial [Parasphingorhabdus sp.]|uniref:helix-turn-helix domain-containing protein n=1 Tax=Parasphingorhabdus sp. TaxID=2709688 RepID=UPI0032982BC8